MTKTILPSLDLQPKLGPRAPTSVWTRSRRPTRRPPQPDQALTRPCDRPPRASPHPRRPSCRHRGGNLNMPTRPPDPRNQTKHTLRANPKKMRHRIPCSLEVWGGRDRKHPQTSCTKRWRTGPGGPKTGAPLHRKPFFLRKTLHSETLASHCPRSWSSPTAPPRRDAGHRPGDHCGNPGQGQAPASLLRTGGATPAPRSGKRMDLLGVLRRELST